MVGWIIFKHILLEREWCAWTRTKNDGGPPDQPSLSAIGERVSRACVSAERSAGVGPFRRRQGCEVPARVDGRAQNRAAAAAAPRRTRRRWNLLRATGTWNWVAGERWRSAAAAAAARRPGPAHPTSRPSSIQLRPSWRLFTFRPPLPASYCLSRRFWFPLRREKKKKRNNTRSLWILFVASKGVFKKNFQPWSFFVFFFAFRFYLKEVHLIFNLQRTHELLSYSWFLHLAIFLTTDLISIFTFIF